MWCHIKCALIKPSEYKIYQNLSSFSWWCPRCLWSSLPFANKTTLDCSLDLPISSRCYDDVHKHENLYPSLKADLQRQGLKISHININGLLNKLLDIKALLFSLNLNILAITESQVRIFLMPKLPLLDTKLPDAIETMAEKAVAQLSTLLNTWMYMSVRT